MREKRCVEVVKRGRRTAHNPLFSLLVSHFDGAAWRILRLLVIHYQAHPVRIKSSRLPTPNATKHLVGFGLQCQSPPARVHQSRMSHPLRGVPCILARFSCQSMSERAFLEGVPDLPLVVVNIDRNELIFYRRLWPAVVMRKI